MTSQVSRQSTSEADIKYDICEKLHPRRIFSYSALDNAYHHKNNRTCYDCANPPCMFVPMCKTCASCRNARCHTQNCNQRLKALHSEHLPQGRADVQNFGFDRCQCIRCPEKLPDSSDCGRERRPHEQPEAKKTKADCLCRSCQRRVSQYQCRFRLADVATVRFFVSLG